MHRASVLKGDATKPEIDKFVLKYIGIGFKASHNERANCAKACKKKFDSELLLSPNLLI